MTRRAKILGAIAILLLGCAVAARLPFVHAIRLRLLGRSTVAERVAQYGPDARSRLAPMFETARVPYPPQRFALVAFKNEGEMHLFAAGPGQDLAFIRMYPVLAASGTLGPKLRSGDGQIPEGAYAIESLNPNSRFHLSLRLDYPSEYDRIQAARDGRGDLGGDIMIHGDSVSVGCLAMGDNAAEELFVLTADSGRERGRVVISPVDFRRADLPRDFVPPTPWTDELYAALRAEVTALPPATK